MLESEIRIKQTVGGTFERRRNGPADPNGHKNKNIFQSVNNFFIFLRKKNKNKKTSLKIICACESTRTLLVFEIDCL